MENEIDGRHQALVDRLVADEIILSSAVEAAFRAVPRHLFLPNISPEQAYVNDAIPTKIGNGGLAISSSSQPSMMALMLEQLALQPGQNVLEIGAGTGFNAALMSYLVGAAGHITTIDIDLDIVEAAREHLDAVGRSNVTVICGDGADGFTGNAPYDAIILTVGGWEIVPAWLEQLKENGRLLLPLSLNGPQFSIAFDRDEDCLTSRSIHACSFMTLRGENAGPSTTMLLNADQTVILGYEAGPDLPFQIDAETVRSWLAAPGQDSPVGLEVAPRQLWDGFPLWMSLHEPQLFSLGGRGEAVGTIPMILGGLGANPWCVTVGIANDEGMALYERPPDWTLPTEPPAEEPEPFDLYIRSYGSAEPLVEQLRQHALAWDGNGRPGVDGMRVRVYPVGEGEEREIAVYGRWHRFVVDWPER